MRSRSLAVKGVLFWLLAIFAGGFISSLLLGYEKDLEIQELNAEVRVLQDSLELCRGKNVR